jgi:hypothetical protein
MRFSKRLLVLVSPDADYEILADDSATHVTLNHKCQAAKHTLVIKGVFLG